MFIESIGTIVRTIKKEIDVEYEVHFDNDIHFENGIHLISFRKKNVHLHYFDNEHDHHLSLANQDRIPYELYH